MENKTYKVEVLIAYTNGFWEKITETVISSDNVDIVTTNMKIELIEHPPQPQQEVQYIAVLSIEEELQNYIVGILSYGYQYFKIKALNEQEAVEIVLGGEGMETKRFCADGRVKDIVHGYDYTIDEPLFTVEKI